LHLTRYKCPETRCVATANRSYLPNVEDYDAIIIHQRGIDWDDMPEKRNEICQINSLLSRLKLSIIDHLALTYIAGPAVSAMRMDINNLHFSKLKFDESGSRSPKQRWIQWVMESAQYLYMDITKLNGMFNWTMTYKRSSDFYLPYGTVHQVWDECSKSM
jgi:hypothetical protein